MICNIIKVVFQHVLKTASSHFPPNNQTNNKKTTFLNSYLEITSVQTFA